MLLKLQRQYKFHLQRPYPSAYFQTYHLIAVSAVNYKFKKPNEPDEYTAQEYMSLTMKGLTSSKEKTKFLTDLYKEITGLEFDVKGLAPPSQYQIRDKLEIPPSKQKLDEHQQQKR
jgi:hypothetical protein